MNKPKLNRAAVSLIAKHLKQHEKGRSLFKQSGESLSGAIALGVPLNTPIKLRDGRQVYLRDQFEHSNQAGGYKIVQRYTVEEWKEPKPKKVAPVEAAETVEDALP